MGGVRRPRKGWIVVAVLSALFGALSAVGALLLLWRGEWFDALLGAGFARAGYWFAYGAWARSPLADVGAVDPVPAPRPLTDAQLRRHLLAAGLAAIALVLALGVQAIEGRWVD